MLIRCFRRSFARCAAIVFIPVAKSFAAPKNAELASECTLVKFAVAACCLARHICADCQADGVDTQLKRLVERYDIGGPAIEQGTTLKSRG